MDKKIKNFMKHVFNNDTWKFHPQFDFIYFERDTDQIFNINTGNYMKNLRTFTNLTKVNLKNTKWEAFNGPTPENKIVRTKGDLDINSTILGDLECVYLNCNKCNTIIKNPDVLSKYCSKRCQLDTKNDKANGKREIDIHTYITQKYSTQKNTNKNIDYDLDYLISLGTTCFYCHTNCTFGNKEYNPDALTYDRKDSDIEYCKENVVVCCWFCNMMKNITLYEDWLQFIEFIKKPELIELDLSNKLFSTNSMKIDVSNVYGSLRKFSPSYYPESGTAKQVFIDLVKKQNYKDSIFNFFPIIYLERNCLWNASIDAIDSTLPNEHKHRPGNLQIIPKCFNYGKSVYTQEQFLKEWTKRKFKTDFSKCTVKIPDNYYDKSYFNKIIN